MTAPPIPAQIGRRNDLDVSPGGPRRPPSAFVPDELAFFPPEGRVRELLDRYRAVRAAGRAASAAEGGGPSPDFRSSVNLTLNRARRLLERWHPDLIGRRCPIETYFRLDGAARRAVERAAGYQLRNVRGSWSTRQRPHRDTPAQARARTLWARADRACEAAEEHERSLEYGLMLAFIGLVLVVWSVHEEPETFWRYVYG